MSENVLEVKKLCKYFDVNRGMKGAQKVIAVDGISFEVKKGETFGLVGESGCGKSTLGRTILRIYEPTKGEIVFEGEDISRLSRKKMLPYRQKLQMIFQDPYASLNPRFTVGEIIEEPMVIHHMYDEKKRKERVQELLETVGLKPDHIRRYPHEFSGGQRQRIGIARTLHSNQIYRLRRTDFGARRFHPGTGHQPFGGYSEKRGHQLSLYRTRSWHGKAYQPPDRCHVSGTHGRDRRIQ